MLVSENLLKMFKKSIGDFNATTIMDNYYTNFLNMAIADLESDMAAEQRARATYEHLMDLTNDPDLLGPLSFLRQREIIHYQRFKELRNYYLEQKI